MNVTFGYVALYYFDIHIVTHYLPSHNLSNFGFLLDLLSKNEFLETIDAMAFFFLVPKIEDVKRSGGLDD